MASRKTSFRLLLPVFLISLTVSVPLRVSLTNSGAKNFSMACFEEERKALLEFKRSLGDSLPQLSSWIGEDCCKWTRIRCSNQTGHVIQLDLSNICGEGSDNAAPDAPMSACLGGELSASLVNLTALNYLDLSGNTFKSIPIPSFIGSLQKLRYLDLSDSGFVGLFPPHLGNLLQLRTLDLKKNSISGSLPASIGNLINLETLDLSENKISGPLPVSVGNLSHLNILDLSFNMINGLIPKTIGQLRELGFLNLWSNQWEGIISESHFENLTRLSDLKLSSKSLVFNVSQEWTPSFSAPFISIRDCKFVSPTFPAWLRSQFIVYIILSNVGISDTIPEWFWRNSPHLGWLDLSNNQLRGKLPNLDQLPAFVNLENNSLEGSIPLWPNVSYLNLGSNRFSGSIPLNIGQEMSSLSSLDLSRNNLSGSIPHSLTTLPMLGSIDLSRNFLSGSIPKDWNGSEGMSTIDLSNNNLSGQFPPSLCSQQPSLFWLRLSNNNLSGELGPSLQNCRNLYTLDLGGNQFSGTIPEWIGEDLQSLRFLLLGENKFLGSIPQQLCTLDSLHVLDLSQNYLSGSVPICLGNLTQLTKLSGMPQPFPSRKDTPDMDLWHIDLDPKGVEYEYTTILPLVNTIDLSSNMLSGNIPEEMRNLSNLGSLNLSRNLLTGKIPEDIGSLQRLQALDLSCNNLQGPIPKSMTFMTSLSKLNLSHNNLSGAIPSANQFQTFNDPTLFEGNLGLCGAPLTTQCSSSPDGNPEVKEDAGDEDEEGSGKMWFYASTSMGFILGFWVVFGSLVLKKSWRHVYFNYNCKPYNFTHISPKMGGKKKHKQPFRPPPKSVWVVKRRNWLEIPDDVTAAILTRVGAIGLLESAQMVCTKWHKICKDPLMWRRIDMRNDGRQHEMDELQKMCRHAVDRSAG
ncbi:hypothetical protein ACLB2K_025191 [Fragaria x ananassa]